MVGVALPYQVHVHAAWYGSFHTPGVQSYHRWCCLTTVSYACTPVHASLYGMVGASLPYFMHVHVAWYGSFHPPAVSTVCTMLVPWFDVAQYIHCGVTFVCFAANSTFLITSFLKLAFLPSFLPLSLHQSPSHSWWVFSQLLFCHVVDLVDCTLMNLVTTFLAYCWLVHHCRIVCMYRQHGRVISVHPVYSTVRTMMIGGQCLTTVLYACTHCMVW